MELANALGNIGLTRYESEVYLALLRLGRCTAGPIIRATGFHRQVVYTALETLQTRGLVSFAVQNNRKNFSPLPPDDLLRREVERFRLFSASIPQMKALQKTAGNELHTETFLGSAELLQSLLSAADSAARKDGLLRIMGGDRGSGLYGFLGSRYSEYVDHVYARGVSKRLIISPGTIEQYRDRFLSEPRAQMRVHEIGFSMPTYSLITQEFLDLGIMTEEAVVLRIWNRAVARAYVEQFDMLWKIARKIPGKKGARSARTIRKRIQRSRG